MHIPDGWLSLWILLLTWGFSLIAISIAVSSIANKEDNLDQLVKISSIAAIIFVAQMFNFPIIGGTSGHLLGATLAVVVIGVSGGILALSVVLLLQAFVFADGGLLALGANIFNIAVVGVLVTYLVLKYGSAILSLVTSNNNSAHESTVKTDDNSVRTLSVNNIVIVFAASVCSVLISSLSAGLELVLSGQASFFTIIPLILLWHIFIAIGEALISIFVVMYLVKSGFQFTSEFSSFLGDNSPKSVTEPSFSIKSINKTTISLGIILILFSILAVLASTNPDGLERVGEEIGLSEGSSFQLGIADDYAFGGIDSFFGILLSAALGVSLLLGIFLLPVLLVNEIRERRAIQS